MRHRCGNIVRANAECQYIHHQVLASNLAHSTAHYAEAVTTDGGSMQCILHSSTPPAAVKFWFRAGWGSLSVPLLNLDVLQPALSRDSDPGTVKGNINYTACQEFIISRSAHQTCI